MSMKYSTQVTTLEVNVSVIEPGRFFQYKDELYLRLDDGVEVHDDKYWSCPCVCVDKADGKIIYMYCRTRVSTVPLYSTITISNQ